MSTNALLKSKIQLYRRQLQLQKELETKKELLLTARHIYSQNTNTANEQMELIKQLSQTQNEYYQQLSVTPPAPDPNISLSRQYKNLIDDLTILSNISNEENDGDELAFPESEEIIPFVDKYSDIYDQLEEWLTDKEKQIEEFNTHHQQLKAVYDELKQQNEELKAKLSEEPDLSGEIETIKEEINKKISTMKSKEEILELNRQKSEELNSLIKAIDASQQEEKREVIKEDKEVNVQQLNELQLKCFRKWEELRQIKYEQYLHERDMKHYLAVIKSQIPNFDV